jgi:hypothetical protein
MSHRAKANTVDREISRPAGLRCRYFPSGWVGADWGVAASEEQVRFHLMSASAFPPMAGGGRSRYYPRPAVSDPA